MKKRERATDGMQQRTSPWQGLQLTLVQSIVCILVLLGMWMLKWIGGDVYAVLAEQFERAMTDDVLVSAVTAQETVTAEALPVQTVVTTATAPATKASDTKTVCAPLKGGVMTSPFGSREDPFNSEEQDVHHGVDIGADEGTRLYAFRDGTVTETGYEEHGYGHYLIVACDEEYSYLYAHCSRIDAQTGQKVKAGECVALVGSSGRSTGSHLHFEWRKHGRAIDPTKILPPETYV